MSIPNVPSHLTIRVLHSDDDVVVIEKPCDLRSVPGHANPPPPERERPPTTVEASADTGSDMVPSSNRRTSQEAWIKAILWLGAHEETRTSQGDADIRSEIDKGGISTEEAAANELINNLGTTANPSCVPRKLKTFVKYCHRNSKRLLPSFPEVFHDRTKAALKKEHCEPTQKKQKRDKPYQQNGKDIISSLMRSIAQTAYAKIQQKHRPLMNLPEPTEDWESAIGQLRLLGFGEYSHCASSGANYSTNTQNGENHQLSGESKLHVVHRIDCQTSGIMVVARNQESASTLCQAWRERDLVQKIYLAHVRVWPPYHQQGASEGTIEIPLAPSRTERIKWEVCQLSEGGKECKTFWRVCEDYDKSSVHGKKVAAWDSPVEKKGIILELHPLTGRTHQLRIHCAAIGSGIVGDSLYGDSPIAWIGDYKNQDTKEKLASGRDEPRSLRLHAHKLTFPNPKSGEKVTFESLRPW